MARYHLTAITGLLAAQAIAGGLNVPLPDNNVFDYIVVGGGPSGLTVANRLSENANVQVLLLESGEADNYPESIMIPYYQGAAGSVNGKCGGFNWCDQTVAQTYLDGGSRTIPQGKGLGGGTLINAMLWNRGDREDYDTWSELGNDGWDYESLLEFFQRANEVATTYGQGYDVSQHGESGPQNVSFPAFQYPASQQFFAALNRIGVPTQPDPAAPTEKGAMYLPQGISQANQSRADARRARWDPVAGRENFYVSTGQHVRRVLFDGGCGASENKDARAVGVEVSAGQNGRIWTAVAAREVILAAGALRTPQLLELSGIGDGNVLAKAGVQSRINLPGVGNNLQDHMLMHMTQGFNNQSYVYPNIMQNSTINDWARSVYYKNRTGPYTFGPPDGNGFFSLPQISDRAQDIAQNASSFADEDYLADGLDDSVIRGYARQRALLIPALNNSRRAVIEFLQDNAGNTQISNQRPFTRGNVHINGTDPFNYPTLDFRYGSNPVDTAVMMDALRFNDELFQQPELQILQPVQKDPPHAASDAQLQEFLNRALGTEFHPSCTAAMMPREDGGVVDSNLLVYGTQNIRVVDASIFPIVPAAHLESVIYAVAEKAADLIKKSDEKGNVPYLPLDQTQCTTASRGNTKRAVHIDQSEAYSSATTSYAASSSSSSSSYSSSASNSSIGAGSYDSSSSMPDLTESAGHGLVGMVGGFPAVGYPNYNPSGTKGFDISASDRPASIGLPVGAALEWADCLINGLLVDPLEGLVRTVDGVVDQTSHMLQNATDSVLGGIGKVLNHTVEATVKTSGLGSDILNGMRAKNERRFVA
ncbi:FAD/NAD(P)-binding domain-containing protein [Aureobasidium sp. EXF-10727]|nr:FAD/NAD(P)-binding domain-containing protein [Aureobasidium sp. EXF-10727]